MAAAFMGGAYWLALFMPKHLDNLKVKEETVTAYNESGRQSDEAITATLLGHLNRDCGTHFEEADDGSMVELPGLGLGPENVSVQRDDRNVYISVRYTRTVKLVPTKNTTQMEFFVEKQGPIPQ